MNGLEKFARILCIPLLMAALSGTVRAQLLRGAKPDVWVIVAPDPSGQWAVSATYPHVVPRSQIETEIKELLAASGWRAGKMDYAERGLRKNDGVYSDRPGKVDPAMSSVTFLSRSPIVDWREATLPLEPFARGFRDLDKVYITFFVPATFPFRGLREHSDANLNVAFFAGRGALTYALTIKNHHLGALNLPRFQLVQPHATLRTAEASRVRGRLRLLGTGFVVLLAAGAGLFAYMMTQRWSGR